jgi:RNA polymerase sigma factor (sigma-70 family)
MEALKTRRREVTDVELHDAEVGLVRLLRKKRFPREWIERNVPDVMAQARTDFAARLAAGKEDDTVNLLVVIGYRRAMKVLDAQLRRPPSTSIETVFHLADESTPTPEQEAIHHDRQERVTRAMASLPERERKLMALVYFDGKSVRDAGRRLGWGKSSADRHHRAALEKLHELLDRSLLSPEISIPAYAAARHWHHSPLRALERWVGGAGETATEAAMAGSGRFGQVAESAGAAATGGGGRTAAGACGVAVAVCLTGAATGVVGPGVGGLRLGSAPSRSATPHRSVSRERTTAAPASSLPAASSRRAAQRLRVPASETARKPSLHQAEAPPKAVKRSAPEVRKQSTRTSPAPAATPKQTVEEFGVEGGQAQSAGEASSDSTPVPAPAPTARPSGESSSSSSNSSSGGSSTGEEFGM